MSFPLKFKPVLFGLFLLISGFGVFNFYAISFEKISYNLHVKPILNKHCLACHGGIKKSGGFSLLFEEEAFGNTESGKPAIIPFDTKNSEFIKRITHHDPEMRMPLDAPPLSESEISILKKWVNQGAKWEKHWAYIPPNPDFKLPELKSDWIRNNIDYFILEKLNENDLKPEKEADRNTLIRRLSLDLTGLPPSPEEVNDFVNDSAPNSYENLVDGLLNSPHFGENRASFWLDLARYADTKGYEKDPYRNIWRFRDWVIQAFNEDMPFDQFTIEQLAGDLLSEPTQNQLIATAFHRNTMTNTEGGTEDEEYRIAAVIDRVNTTMEVWQGTTMSCVQCHSHPYDPFRHEEYYQTFAFFNNTQDADLADEHPNLAFYPSEAVENIDEIIEFIQKLQPEKVIEKDAEIQTKIEQAIFPRLHPAFCDDFHNVQFHGGRWVSNWAYRVQAGEQGRYYFKFNDLHISGLKSIAYTWSSTGNDAVIECRLDSLTGLKLHTFDCTATKPHGLKYLWQDRFKTQKVPVNLGDQNPVSGKHDLIFEIINTTGEIPQGVILMSEIELNYLNQKPSKPAVKKARQDLLDARKGIDFSPVMKERSPAFARKTHVFERGNFLTKGKEVQPKIPEIFPQISKSETPNRPDFAKQLVDKGNPLTARVIVNRFWEQIFGTGLVETSEDFGSQGMLPSHPELLDYLAVRFMYDHEWSVKKLLKEIVMSAAYRQSSTTTPEKTEKDPNNRLLSRGSRYRLSAEQIRDQALAVSGLLYDTIGGKSVMPPQPDGIWQSVYSGEKWETAEGKHRYRRGIYTFWKRTSPYPSMVSFDSPSREVCISRRIRTNTPLQALVTLNDPVFVEAAQTLAEKMKKEGGDDLEACFKFGYKTALVKNATEEVLSILMDLYQKAGRELNIPKATEISNPTGTEEVLLTPMTVVANAILNLDGFVMRE